MIKKIHKATDKSLLPSTDSEGRTQHRCPLHIYHGLGVCDHGRCKDGLHHEFVFTFLIGIVVKGL